MWIKPNYFNKEITEKAKRFQDELVFITNNFFDIMDVYYNNKNLKNTSLCNRKWLNEGSKYRRFSIRLLL